MRQQPVISKNVGRGTILLHRGNDERIGVRWQQDRQDGQGYQGVDLTDWHAEYHMSLNDGRRVYEQDCETSDDGYAIAHIPATAFTDTKWAARQQGTWGITATNTTQNRVELLAWGYFRLEG